MKFCEMLSGDHSNKWEAVAGQQVLELEEVKKVRELVTRSYSITTPLAGLG